MARKARKKSQKPEGNQRLTNKKVAEFLDLLAEYGNVRRACAVAGICRPTLYRKRERDPKFGEAWERAAALGVEALEDETRRRAFEGWEEPVYYKGEVSGTVRKYSDTLMIVLLKAHKPEKYKENVKNEHVGPDGGAIALDMSVSPAVQEIINKLTAE
jgi:hypothetical protein